MNETGSTPNNPNKKQPSLDARDINDVDIDLELDTALDDIPSASESNVYTRTGKAAPTEVLPAAPKPQSAPEPEAPVVPTEKTAEKFVADEEPIKIVGGKTEAPARSEGLKTETLAPVAAGATASTVSLEPTEGPEQPSLIDGTTPAPAAQPVAVDRGTIDFGLLILRVVLGLVLTLTAVATFFQLGTNEGLAGLQDQLANHNEPRILAIALPTMQLAAGVFLLLGLMTPVAAMVGVAAAGFVALDAVAGTVSPFNWDPATWLAVVLLGMALAVQFTGPGLFGVDYSRSWARRPRVSAWIGAAIGLGAAGLLWWFL